MSSATDCRIAGHQVGRLIKKLKHKLWQEPSFQDILFLCGSVACVLAKCVLLILFVKIRGLFSSVEGSCIIHVQGEAWLSPSLPNYHYIAALASPNTSKAFPNLKQATWSAAGFTQNPDTKAPRSIHIPGPGGCLSSQQSKAAAARKPFSQKLLPFHIKQKLNSCIFSVMSFHSIYNPTEFNYVLHLQFQALP